MGRTVSAPVGSLATEAALLLEAIAARLEAAQIAYGRISSMADLASHPQNRIVEVMTPAGAVRMLAPAILIDGQPTDPGPVPALGQHTAAALAEFAAG